MLIQSKTTLAGGFALYANCSQNRFFLSPQFSRQATFPTMSVSSLYMGLTSLFGMGRGVTPGPNQEN